MLMDRWWRGFPRAVMLADVNSGRLTSGEWANGVYDWTADLRYDPWPAGPVREVRFSNWDVGSGEVLWYPQLKTVRSLSLGEWYAGVRMSTVEEFVTALSLLLPGHFSELTSLDLGGEVNLDAFETLAESAVVGQLTELTLQFPDDVPAIEWTDWQAAARRLFRAAPQLESLALENPPADVLLALAALERPGLRSFRLNAPSLNDVVALAVVQLPQLEHLSVASYPATGVGWTENVIVQLTRCLPIQTLKSLTVSGVTTSFVRQLFAGLYTPHLASLSVFGGRSDECRLSAADLAERDTFRGLKTLRGPLTNADLAALANPDVLPELHTIWSNDTAPLTGLRWRGGVRTVIPKDPRGGPHRGTRGSWCG